MGDPVTIDMKLLKAKRDFSRFTIVHTIKKNPETIAAVLTVDIAWINGVTRKLAVLPEEDRRLFDNGHLAVDFQWLD